MRRLEFAHARILVVDDEPANVHFLERLLAKHGYTEVASCSDSRGAADQLARCPPDLLLLDLHMPGDSGFEILDQLRGTATIEESIPVIVLTADATSGAKLKALEFGAGATFDGIASDSSWRGEIAARGARGSSPASTVAGAEVSRSPDPSCAPPPGEDARPHG